jgi:PAS domain S-box-containing protein
MHNISLYTKLLLPFVVAVLLLFLGSHFFAHMITMQVGVIIGIGSLALLALSTFLTVRRFISEPLKALADHMENFSQGDFQGYNKSYKTREIDRFIDDVNRIGESINKREKATEELHAYIKDIFDSQSDIIIVNDREKTVAVNGSFFKFFDQFQNLEDFLAQHTCVCEFFEKEEGYLYAYEDKNWVEYIIDHPEDQHKAKITKAGEEYIFKVEAIRSLEYNRIIISIIDITELITKEKELRSSLTLIQEYKKAVDSSAIVSKTDTGGKITYVNDIFCNISGYTKEELLGQNHNIIRHPDMPASIYADLWQTISAKEIWYGKIKNRTKGGGSYYVNATIIPILGSNGQVNEYMAIRYDITQEVNAQIRSELAERAKSQFLANMSHEIRTPLNAIIGFTKLLLNMEMEQKQKSYMETIDVSSNTLMGIINDILDFSKIESGVLDIERTEFNPFEVFEHTIDLFSAKSDEKSIDFLFYIDTNLPKGLIGDPHRIKQVLSNLIGNAIKFTPEAGSVRVDIKLIHQQHKRAVVEFSVQDTGIGIAKEKQKEIFNPFSQEDSSVTRRYGGTGLGLSISARIIEAMNSQIVLESALEHGSRFSFRLAFDVLKGAEKPKLGSTTIGLCCNEINAQMRLLQEYLSEVTDVEVVESVNCQKDIVFVTESVLRTAEVTSPHPAIIMVGHIDSRYHHEAVGAKLFVPFGASKIFNAIMQVRGERESKSKERVEQKRYRLKVLVAEDHPINQKLVSALLDVRGVKYDIVGDGHAAYEKVKQEHYNLILMDVNMPTLDGIGATKKIIEFEKREEREHTPIIALTANALQGDKERFIAAGMDGYIAKPIQEYELDSILTKFHAEECNGEWLHKACESVGIPMPIYKKIVESFFETVQEDIHALERAIEEDSKARIAEISHKIYGAVVNIRIEEIAAIARTIENNAKSAKSVNYHDLFEKLIKEINKKRGSFSS